MSKDELDYNVSFLTRTDFLNARELRRRRERKANKPNVLFYYISSTQNKFLPRHPPLQSQEVNHLERSTVPRFFRTIPRELSSLEQAR